MTQMFRILLENFSTFNSVARVRSFALMIEYTEHAGRATSCRPEAGSVLLL